LSPLYSRLQNAIAGAEGYACETITQSGASEDLIAALGHGRAGSPTGFLKTFCPFYSVILKIKPERFSNTAAEESGSGASATLAGLYAGLEQYRKVTTPMPNGAPQGISETRLVDFMA